MSVKDCSRPPGSDIWAHFAGFLAELIARHAEELDIDSWPDPKKVIMLQELRDMYYRFMKLSLQARKEADAKLPLEIKADIWYSPYIQISGFEEMEEQGISQYRLSKMTGISTKTISDWRSKKTNPGADKIMVICEALQISPEMLLTGRGRTETSGSLPYIDTEIKEDAEGQLVDSFRTFSEDKKRRLLAYMNMLENTKE